MYIGNTPAENYASFLTETFTVSATASYTLSHAVANENDIRLVINGVVQQPGSGKAYTASGTTLTLTSATVSGDVMYAVYLGRALQTVNPPNASVGNSQTAPTIITGQTAETSIATDDTILIHDTSASALRKMTRANFVSGIGGDNTPTWLVTKNADQTISNTTNTVVTWQTEINDSDTAFASNKFTVPSGKGGLYFLNAQIRFNSVANASEFQLAFKKNGGYEFNDGTQNNYIVTNTLTGAAGSPYFQNNAIVNLSAGDYIEVAVYTNDGPKDLNKTYCRFSGYKLIT
nr:c1q globular head like domain containing protein [uncultured Mediterranean phage uvMED]